MKSTLNNISKSLRNTFVVSRPSSPRKHQHDNQTVFEDAYITPRMLTPMREQHTDTTNTQVDEIHDLIEKSQAKPSMVPESPKATIAPAILFSPVKRELKTLSHMCTTVTNNNDFESSEEDKEQIEAFESLNELAEQLRGGARQKLFSDVTIQLVGCKDKFYAHRIFLSLRSGYFRTLLARDEYANKDKVAIEFTEFPFPDIFSRVLEYIYTGKISLNLHDILEVLLIADKLQIEGLKQICGQYIEQYVDTGNACYLLELSVKYSCLRLSKYCIEFVDKNIKPILQNSLNTQFNDISEDTLTYIIKRDELYLTCDEEILLFQAIVNWAKCRLVRDNKQENDTQALRARCETLLNHVRFPLMTSEQIANIVEPTQVTSQQLLFEAYKYHLVKQQGTQNAFRYKPRLGHEAAARALQEQQQQQQQEQAASVTVIAEKPVELEEKAATPTKQVVAQQDANKSEKRAPLSNITNDKKKITTPPRKMSLSGHKSPSLNSSSLSVSAARKLFSAQN